MDINLLIVAASFGSMGFVSLVLAAIVGKFGRVRMLFPRTCWVVLVVLVGVFFCSLAQALIYVGYATVGHRYNTMPDVVLNGLTYSGVIFAPYAFPPALLAFSVAFWKAVERSDPRVVGEDGM